MGGVFNDSPFLRFCAVNCFMSLRFCMFSIFCRCTSCLCASNGWNVYHHAATGIASSRMKKSIVRGPNCITHIPMWGLLIIV